ncbi:MAG: hypothetical protein OET90_08255 [Desulfuromonadales bacterium]|nr:hypothetical protein [Desulfuromonadales bacterium]
MNQRVLFILVFLLLVFSSSSLAEIVLITDLENPVSEISTLDAKNIFLGKRRSWADGSMLIPVTQVDRAATDQFSRKYLNMSVAQYNLYWRQMLFTGTGLPPLAVADDAAMKKMVATKLGAIGYISASSLDATVKKLEIR